MYRRAILATAVGFGMVGCFDSTGPGSRSIGTIQPGRQRDVILAPDTVDVNTRFDATVNSFGSSTCVIPDGVDLILTDNLAIITPYDRHPAGQAICSADVAPRPHPVILQFSAAGVATIEVIGFRLTDSGKVLTSVERSVVVRSDGGVQPNTVLQPPAPRDGQR